MMPTLFVILLIIIIRGVTLPNAGEGLAFIFSPAGKTFNLGSINAALGQVFYSLSLCMGITITYGSYLNKQENIPKSCVSVAALDTVMALCAGIAIFPAVFSFGLEPGEGPALIFGTLPKVFSEIGGGCVFCPFVFPACLFCSHHKRNGTFRSCHLLHYGQLALEPQKISHHTGCAHFPDRYSKRSVLWNIEGFYNTQLFIF